MNQAVPDWAARIQAWPPGACQWAHLPSLTPGGGRDELLQLFLGQFSMCGLWIVWPLPRPICLWRPYQELLPLNAAPRFTGIHKPLHHDKVVILGGAFEWTSLSKQSVHWQVRQEGAAESSAVSPYEGEIKVTRCAKNRIFVLYMWMAHLEDTQLCRSLLMCSS